MWMAGNTGCMNAAKRAPHRTQNTITSMARRVTKVASIVAAVAIVNVVVAKVFVSKIAVTKVTRHCFIYLKVPSICTAVLL